MSTKQKNRMSCNHAGYMLWKHTPKQM